MTQLRHHYYQTLLSKIPLMEAEGRAWAEAEGLADYAGRYGTYQGSSSTPARLPDYVLEAIVASSTLLKNLPLDTETGK